MMIGRINRTNRTKAKTAMIMIGKRFNNKANRNRKAKVDRFKKIKSRSRSLR